MKKQINDNAEVISLKREENGNFPNNPYLPVLLYKNVFDFNESGAASMVERIFFENKWGGSWRNGIFSYHHYHSTAHEVLGVYNGWAEVLLGGPGVDPIRNGKGDLAVLPAGTAHKKLNSGDNFAVVGAYPCGQNYDMNYGKKEELTNARQNIASAPLPEYDPVFGKVGKIFQYWQK